MNPKLTKRSSSASKNDGVSGGAVTPDPIPKETPESADGLSGDEKEALLESRPESDRWNPVADSPGKQLPEQPAEDEDTDDGRNESARLVEGGVEEAEDEQARQASKRARQRD